MDVLTGRVARLLAAVVLPGLLWSSAVQAEYPERPIRLVVGFAPGGVSDSTGRIIGQALGDRLKKPVVIESRPGAATIVATELVKNAAPDGYTLLMSTATTFVYNAIIYKSLPYTPADFDAIGMFGASALALVANNELGAKPLPQLVREIKAKPEAFPYGSLGNGSSTHFAAEALWAHAQVKLTHIPFNGSGPMLTALAGGHIPLSFDTTLGAVTARRTGNARVVAVTSRERSALMPEVPTIAESGFPGFNVTSWFAIIAPRGLPAPVAARLRQELSEVVLDKAVQQKLVGVGIEPKYGTPAEFSAAIREDIEKLKPIAVANNIRAD